MISRRALVIGLAALAMTQGLIMPADAAEDGIMTPADAHEAVKSGEVVLVDIRTPDEWRQTGVAEGAHAMSMHDGGFLDDLNALIEREADKPIAIICATGGRTGWLRGELLARGYNRIIDVSRGMMGNPTGPGWIAEGLPVLPYGGN